MKKQTFLVPILFIVSLLLILFISNSWKVFDYPPKSVHQWRQSDCAAYVKTYYGTGSALMQPATYNLAGKNGKVASEFPILYYVAAKIQHLVGAHYWVVRGLTFLCFVIGLIALLAIAKRWIRHPVLVLFPIILLATSPYYYYYAINYLPNIPAISFSFAGLYFFLKFKENRNRLSLLWGTMLFILATALKPTDGGILWLAFVAAVLCTGFSQQKVENKKSILAPVLLASLIIGSCIFAWAKYVNWYNDENGNHQNLIGIYPVWHMDKGLMQYTAKRVLTEWSNVFQQKLVLIFLGFSLLVFVWKWKHLDTFLKWFTLWVILGTFAYSILWFKAYTDHDYYQLPLMLPCVFLSITMLAYFEKNIIPVISDKIRIPAFGVIILLMLAGVYHNRNIQKDRYSNPGYVYVNPAMFEVGPYLKTLGIQQTDAIVCVPDKSPNISLNAIDHYGYTEEFNSTSYNIRTFKAQGAAYLIISDSSYLSNPVYLPFTNKKIGEYRGVYVFDIR